MSVRLVSVGDSLAQGFQSGAISRSEWSYPAMVARALGVEDFPVPDFSGEHGLPLNLEALLRAVGERHGSRVSWYDMPAAFITVSRFLDRVETYWERGPGTGADPTCQGRIPHNLAVWGFELGDADTVTDGLCAAHIPAPRDQSPLGNQLPEVPMYRTARRVLNPGQSVKFENMSQLDLVGEIAREEGVIENVLIALGANNALGACTTLDLSWSKTTDIHKFPHERAATIWHPPHFETVAARVLGRLRALQEAGQVERVFVATVPNVVVAPLVRGVSPVAWAQGLPPGEHVDDEGFFEFYTHFWLWDEAFCNQPEAYPRLTRESAALVARTIAAYNRTLGELAARFGWHLVPIGQMFEDLAFRKSGGKPRYRLPQGLIQALTRNPATEWRVFPPGDSGESRVLLDTRYYQSCHPSELEGLSFEEAQRKTAGGLVSLDGVHPSTVGYGLMASELLQVMSTAGVPGASPEALDWDAIVAADSLLSAPLGILTDLRHTLGFLSGRTPLGQLARTLAGYGAQGPSD